MSNFFRYDNKLFLAINKIVDSAFLSILWLVTSLPIVTIGASSTALYYTVNKVLVHDRSHIWREYWRAFKSNFKQSTIVWLVLMAAYWILVANCIIMYNLSNSVLLALYIILICITATWMLHLFPHIARFENKTRLIMKNCAILAVRHIIKSIILFLLFAASVMMFWVQPLLILVLPALYTYFATVILEPIFRKYMTEEDLEAEEERNRIYYN